jgi:hypothetical protein
MAQRVSSRRVKIEQHKAQRNMVIAIVISGVVGVAFLVLAVPLLFEFAVDFARNNTPVQVVADTLPPQKPVFQPPEEHVKDTKLVINGYTEAAAQVQLMVDSQEKAITTAAEDGAFTFESDLSEGEHVVLVSAKDEAGNTSSTNEYLVTVDVTVPSLTIDSPSPDTTFTLRSERVVKVIGSMNEPGTVYVNGAMNSTDEEGKFESTLSLGEGENTITVRGEDLAGNPSEETSFKVFYRP